MTFYVIATLICVTAILVIANTNPLLSALFLAASLFLQAVLFALMGAHLVAALQVLIYAGAVIVMILIVIMLLNLRSLTLKFKTISFNKIIMSCCALYLSVVISFALYMVYKEHMKMENAVDGTIEKVGYVLFTRYIVPFELSSILLLVAIIGTIVMLKKKACNKYL